ncbi:MAG: hypothetical protein EOP09_11010 [Proteobacteria bacterium]|nr:MAG: hypothetical protein EOP09_11010 [Pseudomonadota bacterium]
MGSSYANQKLITLSHVVSNHLPKIQSYFNQETDSKFYSGKAKITIGAPLPSDIRAMAVGKTVVLASSDNSIQIAQEKDEYADADFSGAVIKNGYIEISGEAVCSGDVVVTGAPIFLKNAVIKTTKKGCRIYSEKSVFTLSTVSGGSDITVHSVNGSSLTTENIQISSGQAISMGYGSNSFRTDYYNDSADDATKAARPTMNYSDQIRAHGCSTWGAVMKTPGMSIVGDGSNPSIRAEGGGSMKSLDFFNSVLYPQSTLINDLGAGYPDDQFCTLKPDGKNAVLKKDNSRILLNAPWVLRKYNGLFTGAVIAEMAHMTIGGFNFTYDSSFDDSNVPILPLIPASVHVLEITD